MYTGKVLHYEIQYDSRGKRFVRFQVNLQCPREIFIVYRRYNEFRTLHSYLSKHFSEFKFKFPPRRIFGSSFDMDFLLQRKSGLDHFISEMSHISDIMNDECVISFFTQELWEYSTLLRSLSQSTPMEPLMGDYVGTDISLTQSSHSSVSSTASTSSLIRGVIMRTLSFFTKPKASSGIQCRRCISEPLIDTLTEEFSRCSSPSEPFARSSNYYRRLSANDFQFIKMVGKGSFGKVFLVRYKHDQQFYAMKVISKDLIKEEADYRHIMSERNILSQDMEHPFLVKLKCTFQSESKLYIVMQFVNGGEIFFHLQKEVKFAELRAKFYAAEIVSAFEFLHSKDIVYRDLKPENILLDSAGHVVLVDFGLAKDLIKTTCTRTFCGTPEYLAPEVILNKQYGKEIDWWCLGSVLYEMLTGLPPFYSKSRTEIFDKVIYDHPSFSSTSMSPEARDLICRLLKKSPQNRLGHGVDGAEDVKQHPFFEGIDWDKLYNKKYQPPYIPHIKVDHGLDNFDPEFLRESISASVFDAPFQLEASICSSVTQSPVLSSESDTDRMCDAYSYHACQNFEQLWNDPTDRQLLFVGFSYADTVEL